MDYLKDNKYNYIIYNAEYDYLQPIFGKLSELPYVKNFKRGTDLGLLTKELFFIHWSKEVNKRIHLPKKYIWFKKMFDIRFDNDKPTCYIFYEGKYIMEDLRVDKYIKSLNPNNKCVIYFGDLISKMKFDIITAKKHSDLMMTYDEGEAKKFGINHYDDIFYGPLIDVTTPTEFENDVYFLGFAKDRLNDIHNTFFALRDKGFKCKFIICGVDKSLQFEEEGLIYRKPISYIENLENVSKSKCVLELIQGGSSSLTLRTSESQVFMRKLLTNNKGIVNQEYYDSNNMSVFSSVEDINFDFINKPIDYESFTKRDMYNPNKLIEYIENALG